MENIGIRVLKERHCLFKKVTRGVTPGNTFRCFDFANGIPDILNINGLKTAAFFIRVHAKIS